MMTYEPDYFHDRQFDLNRNFRLGYDVSVSDAAKTRGTQMRLARRRAARCDGVTYVMRMTITWYRCEICDAPVVNGGENVGTCDICQRLMNHDN